MSATIKKSVVGGILYFLAIYSGIAYAQHDHHHGAATQSSSQDARLVNELKGIDAKQAMNIAYKWRSEKIDVKTFVTPDAVNFKFKDGKTVVVPLPDDQMIVSVAPYINKTHPCSTHTMSSCEGELKNKLIEVRAVTAEGKTLIHETLRTPPTGFVDLWLPRDQEITISVDFEGKKGTSKVQTYRTSKTCDSTIKLE